MSKSIKDIKRMVINQIKKEHPNFNRLPKKFKKKIIKKIYTQIYTEYDSSKEPEIPLSELLNIDSIPDKFISLEKMQQLIRGNQLKISHLSSSKENEAIKDDQRQLEFPISDN